MTDLLIAAALVFVFCPLMVVLTGPHSEVEIKDNLINGKKRRNP